MGAALVFRGTTKELTAVRPRPFAAFHYGDFPLADIKAP